MKITIDFIVFSIFYIFIKIFNFLSPRIRLKISEFIGVLLFYLIPKGRKLSYRNLNLILNEQNNFNYSKKKIKEIAIKSYKNTAKSFLLPFWIYEYFENFSPKIYNSELLEKLKSENERIILVTSHFGFFHASLFPTRNDTMFIPIRIISNKFIESYMDKIRFKNNMTYFPEQNYKSFLKNKNSKGVFVLLSDVRKPDGNKITFFGLPTTNSGFPAYFSKKENIPIVIIHNEVDENNICHIFIDKVIHPENYKNRHEIMKSILTEYEKIILKLPEQWFWFQERWKELEK